MANLACKALARFPAPATAMGAEIVARIAVCDIFRSISFRSVSRFCVSILIGQTCAAALAAQDGSPFPPIASATNPTYHTSDDRLSSRPDAGNTSRNIHYAIAPLTLVELDGSLKRQDLQSVIGTSKSTIAVIYPDLGEPYHSIFAKIIEGIEEKSKAPVHSYPIAPNVDMTELNAQLKVNGIKVVIALGRQGVQAAAALDSDIAVVVGGVLSIPEADNRRLTGVSLTPDPALLFARLKNLRPGVKRVLVVFDPQRNDWLIKMALEAAKAQGLELVQYEAHDLASAARMYDAAFAAADGHRDAVWLPQDATTVDEGTILPLVLRESWTRGVPVFSSSFLHVKKGALFALYPNNLELGHALANSAQGVLAGESGKHGLLPLREVNIAVNLRTASHIGLNIGFQQQRSFDSVFPEP